MYSPPRTDMAPTLAERYAELKERVATAASRSGRSPEQVLVVAVSKYADMDQVRELIRLGHQDFGESRALQLVQRASMVDEMQNRGRTIPSVAAARLGDPFDLRRRAPAPGEPPEVRWHLIGHLQRNKVKKLIGVARLIHSVDSLRLVEEIQHIAFKRDEPVEVLVQVNCSGEKSKFGCAVPAALHLCEQIETTIHIRVRGLMTMAPYSDNPEDARPTFDRCRELFTEIRRQGVVGPHFNILSMGMTNDFEVGIECGSNMVRIGSALFGEHQTIDEHAETEEED
ncbi:MAG: YggS family pyridoxal phosphate-dependent enzyme [Planctomycetota bacterium]|nr:YggS family pyridoxal phosphate-dependent enzyme [Planctomycetota bacterium]